MGKRGPVKKFDAKLHMVLSGELKGALEQAALDCNETISDYVRRVLEMHLAEIWVSPASLKTELRQAAQARREATEERDQARQERDRLLGLIEATQKLLEDR